MAIFGRRHANASDTNAATATADASTGRHRRREKAHRGDRFNVDSGSFNRRPSFGQWLKMTWLDILTMAAMGAIGLGIYEAKPAPSRSFPVYFQDGEIVYPQFAYPLRHEIVPIWLAALLGSLIPIAIILFVQIRVRSFWVSNSNAWKAGSYSSILGCQ